MVLTDSGLMKVAREAWRPPPELSLSEWADRYAQLSPESSATAGQWRTLPYQKGIMDAFTDPTVEVVAWQKSARVGATKIINNLIGYHIHQDPCPMMVVQPTVEDAEGYSRDEIAPMVRDTPVLRGLVADPKEKAGGNLILSKSFPGGTLGMVGANSARGFRRVSRRVVLFDETDAYPPTTKEGDQIKLGIKRSDYYWNRKIGLASTPTTKEFSRIERWFLRTDQRRYFVPCPFCGAFQYLKWQQMKWKDRDASTAAYECESCKELIPHSHKRAMVAAGEWRPTAKSERGGLVGFHLWAAYSFSPNATWSHLVDEFLQSKDNPEELRTFVNTVLGETYEDEYSARLAPSDLVGRCESYEPGTCPEGVLVLTAGVDVQDNRLAVSVWGWGRGEEAWKIWHQEIYGDPTQEDVWAQLDTVLATAWPLAGGGEMAITGMGVDSGGHCTHEVYEYARRNRRAGVVPVKGLNRRGGQVMSKGAKVDVNRRGKVLKNGVTLYQVGTDTVKTTVYGRLKHSKDGAGRFHFGAGTDEEYFAQLTAEKRQERHVKGFKVIEWVKKSSDRNEALDCLVYAYAVLQLVARRYNRATMWAQMEKVVAAKRTQPAPPAQPEEPAEREEEPRTENARRRRAHRPGGRRCSDYVTSW